MKTKSKFVLCGTLIQVFAVCSFAVADQRPSYECSVASNGSEKSILFNSDADTAVLRVENVFATVTRPTPFGLHLAIADENIAKLESYAYGDGRPTRLEAVLIHPFGDAGFIGKVVCVLTH